MIESPEQPEVTSPVAFTEVPDSVGPLKPTTAVEKVPAHASPTEASNSWLKTSWHKTKRWTSHVLYTVGSEAMTIAGMVLTPVGIAATIISGNPLPLVLTAPSIIGAAVGWHGGAKNAGRAEKLGFLGTQAVAPASIFLGPYGPTAMAYLTTASTGLATRHRK